MEPSSTGGVGERELKTHLRDKALRDNLVEGIRDGFRIGLRSHPVCVKGPATTCSLSAENPGLIDKLRYIALVEDPDEWPFKNKHCEGWPIEVG